MSPPCVPVRRGGWCRCTHTFSTSTRTLSSQGWSSSSLRKVCVSHPQGVHLLPGASLVEKLYFKRERAAETHLWYKTSSHLFHVFQVNGSSDCVTAHQLPSLSKVWGELWSPQKITEVYSYTINFMMMCMFVLGSRSVMLFLEMNDAGWRWPHCQGQRSSSMGRLSSSQWNCATWWLPTHTESLWARVCPYNNSLCFF